MPEYFEKRRGLFLGLALVVMTVLAYLPAIRYGGFIWDDESYVIYNNTLRDFSGLKDIWTNHQATPQYYPLVHTAFWVEYQLWELNPTGYHANNVLLHAMASVLLWLVLRRIKVPGAWLAACLFALHPVHVESVAWITERKNVLSGVFYLGSALVYLKWVDSKAGDNRRPIAYWTAFILFVAALLSKTVTTSLPAALLLVAWWKDGEKPEQIAAAERPGTRRIFAQILPLVPFFALGLVLSGVTVWLEKHHVGAKGAEWDLSFIDRCLIAGRALWFYIGKLLWPSGLCFSYPRWDIDAVVWWQYLYPLTFAVLIGLLWAARKRLGRGPLVAVLFFAGTLFPALGFFDVYPMRYSFVADHFNYLASIGILVLVGAGIVRGCGRAFPAEAGVIPKAGFVKRFGVRWLNSALQQGSLQQKAASSRRTPKGVLLQRTLIVVTAPLLILLAGLTWKQCAIYHNLETLWLDTIAKNPASWMAYNNLGKLYLEQGRAEESILLLEDALRHHPQMGIAYRNLGVALSRLGRIDEAMENFRRALEVDPKDAETYSNMGAALAREGQFEDAETVYLKALEIDPDMALTHSNLGSALGRMGRFAEAIPYHKKALAFMPERGIVHLHYGETLHAAGRVREAADQYREVVSLDPSLAGAYINLGQIATEDKLLDAAIDYFRRAVEVSPNLADAHRHLAKTLVAIGQLEEAEKCFSNAMSLDPDSMLIRAEYAEILNRLGVLLASQGTRKTALGFLRRSTELIPQNAEYRNNLGVMLVRIGKRDEALKELMEAVRLNPEYGEALKNLEDLKQLRKESGEL